MDVLGDQPDPDQGHARQWPDTPYTAEASAPEPLEETASSIALVGDCTLLCDYLPPANRPENHLRIRLRRVFPARAFLVRNFAANGGSAEDFITSGRWSELSTGLRRLDVAFIRFGINDRKQHGIPGCIDALRRLHDNLLGTFPGALVILETGIWVDYPQHYLWDRNRRLAPLYDAIADLAAERRLPLLDIFRKTREQTAAGNWDLRIRGLPDPQHAVIDNSLDEFFGHDPAFFTNIHPNSRGIGLIADWQAELLGNLWRGVTGRDGND